MKVNAQILSVALGIYATSSSLAGGSMARGYGFNVSPTGTGADSYNVGSDGAAYGVPNNGCPPRKRSNGIRGLRCHGSILFP